MVHGARADVGHEICRRHCGAALREYSLGKHPLEWMGIEGDQQPASAIMDFSAPEMMIDAYAGRPDQLIEEFDRQAQECVRGGADVVICGCNPYVATLGQVGYNQVIRTGVPVVTPMAA